MDKNVNISVIMSVYNTKEEYLRIAIESILNQTYTDFEFIIINDYSNEETTQILNSYKDPRIIIINNSQNLGLTKSLNIGLRVAKGKYIARMDSDDISLPERLYQQLMYMEANKDISLLGTYTRGVSKRGINAQHWSNNDQITRIRLLFYNSGIAHPTAFFRKEHLDKYDIFYDESIVKAQDYAMWVEIMKYGKMDILPSVLLEYRVHEGQISVAGRSNQVDYGNITRLRQLSSFKQEFTEEEKRIFCRLSKGDMEENAKIVSDFLVKLIKINDNQSVYNKRLFRFETTRIWLCASLKRIFKLHKFDMLFNQITLKILIPSYFLHWIQYCLCEDARIRCLMFKSATNKL